MPLPLETFNTCDNREMSSTQFFEQEFATIRRHGSALIIPVLVLAMDAFLFLFIDWRLTETWQHQLLLGVVLLVGMLFWLIPSLRYFTNRIEITSNRIVIHTGIIGTRTQEVPWGELTGASVTRSFGSWLRGAGDVRLHREFGQDLILPSVPRAKRLAREIEKHLAGNSRAQVHGKIDRG